MSLVSSSVAGSGRVPVEHRLLGMDKRSFPYAFFVIGVFLVATVIIPLIDRAIPWDDPVVAGDRLALSKTIAFTPTTGWNVENGFRLTGDGPATQSGEATVVGEGVTFDIVPGAFDGSPPELLNQVATSRAPPTTQRSGWTAHRERSPHPQATSGCFVPTAAFRAAALWPPSSSTAPD